MFEYFREQVKFKEYYLQRFFKGDPWFRNRKKYFYETEKNLSNSIRSTMIEDIKSFRINGEPDRLKIKVKNFGYHDVFSIASGTPLSFTVKFPFQAENLIIWYGIGKNNLKAKDSYGKLIVMLDDKKVRVKKITWKDLKNAGNDEIEARNISIDIKEFRGEEKNITIRWKVEGGLDPDLKIYTFDFSVTESFHLPRRKSSGSRKNIVLILCDALRKDRVFTELTPFLNSQERNLLRIEKMYSVSSWTFPAVTSMCTGVYPFRHKVYRYDHFRLKKGIPLLQEVLRENNYVTSFFTSNPLVKAKYGFDAGFDSYLEIPLIKSNNFLPFIEDWVDYFSKDYNFFIYLHAMDTHTPYIAPSKCLKKSSGHINIPVKKMQKLILNANETSDLKNISEDIENSIIDRYNAQVRFFDMNLEKLIDYFKKKGLLDNTIFIITADHGEELFEREKFTHGYNLCNSLVTIPFLVLGKDLPALTEKREFINMDIFPSILDLAGISANEDIDGVSVFKDTVSRPLFLSTHDVYYRGEGWFSKFGVVWNDLKLIYFPKTEGWEFYDLNKDPLELNNGFNELSNKERIEKLKSVLFEFLEKEDRSILLEKEGLDENLKKSLKGLGYI
ncbi:MAG: sulfatase [bacterium]|nr:sulfatase [bacterium]